VIIFAMSFLLMRRFQLPYKNEVMKLLLVIKVISIVEKLTGIKVCKYLIIKKRL
jgi:hypothetical protein